VYLLGAIAYFVDAVIFQQATTLNSQFAATRAHITLGTAILAMILVLSRRP